VKKECLRAAYHPTYEAFTAAIDKCLSELDTTHKKDMDECRCLTLVNHKGEPLCLIVRFCRCLRFAAGALRTPRTGAVRCVPTLLSLPTRSFVQLTQLLSPATLLPVELSSRSGTRRL
jgi:hypothetical protein